MIEVEIVDAAVEAGLQALRDAINAKIEHLSERGFEIVGPVSHAVATIPEQGDFYTAIITYRKGVGAP